MMDGFGDLRRVNLSNKARIGEDGDVGKEEDGDVGKEEDGDLGKEEVKRLFVSEAFNLNLFTK